MKFYDYMMYIIAFKSISLTKKEQHPLVYPKGELAFPGVAMGFVVSGDSGAGSGGGMLFKALDALKSGKASGGKPFIQKI